MKYWTVALFLVAACGGPTSADDGDTEEGALAERWTSPIVPGSYDADEASITVRQGLQDQDATYDAPNVFVYGSISVGSGQASFTDRTEKTSTVVLTPVPASADLVARRDKQGASAPVTFVRRRPGALVGTYVNAASKRVQVEASTDDSITFTVEGARVVAKLHSYFIDWPNRYTADARPSAFPEGCFVVVKRSRGQFYLQIAGETGGHGGPRTTCPVAGDYVR